MEIIEISVPYTGTNFLAKLFTDRGFQRIGMTERASEPDVIRVAHCIKPTQVDPALKHASEGKPLVLPCRHPFRVEESFKRKGQDDYLEMMIPAFENLIHKFAPLTDLVLCVDSPRREQQLEHIKKTLGLPLETEWPVVASKSGTYHTELPDFRPSRPVLNLLNENREFFGRFYGLV